MFIITKDFETFTENAEDPGTDPDLEEDLATDLEIVFSIRQDRPEIQRMSPSNRPF